MAGIEWTDETWNPIVGCSVVSPGCTNCYAMKMAYRIRAASEVKDGASHYCGTVRLHENGNAIWTGKVALAPDHILTAPLRWKKPRRIFVNSMGDVFHESVPDEWIDKVFAIMALSPQHTFQVLTKRAERMRKYMQPNLRSTIYGFLAGRGSLLPPSGFGQKPEHVAAVMDKLYKAGWPLPNVWLGVSAERQQEADERIPHLLATPAAIRFVSAEPLLGPIDLQWAVSRNVLDIGAGFLTRGMFAPGMEKLRPLDWLIVGGESGPNARPMNPDWARSLRDQCAAAGVPFFFKQWGEWGCLHQSKEGQHGQIVQGFPMVRVGKKAAGRLLDGVLYSAWPRSANASRPGALGLVGAA